MQKCYTVFGTGLDHDDTTPYYFISISDLFILLVFTLDYYNICISIGVYMLEEFVSDELESILLT
jgi:hypothetical protein